MDVEAITAMLREMGLEVHQAERLGDDDGWRVAVANGAVIYSFDNGRLVVHGPGASALRMILKAQSDQSAASKLGGPASTS